MTNKLKTNCPSCEKRLRIDEAKRGKTVRCPSCREAFTVRETFVASEMTIDTAPAAVSIDTTQLAKDETLGDLVSPAAQSLEEATLRKLGRFELKSVLGAGGFGKVYRAYDPQLERFVALKVPTFGPNQKTRIARFLAEAKAAARLKHANIVSTFETGKADKKHYIASEFIEGHLLSALAKRERFSVKDSATIVRKLAEAVAYAHGQGIVHRDIKPHNVMIDSAGEPQLMDFGLAKRTDDSSNLTTDGALLGTPAYMSPEQARGELQLVNESSDQYSLGVLLYYLLTGTTPCEGSPHMVIAEVAKGDFHSVRDRDTTIDRTLDAICQKAMHPEQAQRYPNCNQFAEDLDAWIEGRPAQARPLSFLQKAQRFAAANVVLAFLFTMILGLAFLTTVLGWKVMSKEDGIPIASDDLGTDAGKDTSETGDTLNSADDPSSSTAVPGLNYDLLVGVNADDCRLQGVVIDDANGLVLHHAKPAISQEAIVELPFLLPAQYELVCEITKMTPKGCLVISFPHSSVATSLVLDGSGGSGITHKVGSYSKNSTTVSAHRVFPDLAKAVVIRVCSVANRLSVYVNDTLLTEFADDPSLLAVGSNSRHWNSGALALKAAHRGQFVVSKVSLNSATAPPQRILPKYLRSTPMFELLLGDKTAAREMKNLLSRCIGELQTTPNAKSAADQTVRLTLSGCHQLELKDLRLIRSITKLDSLSLGNCRLMDVVASDAIPSSSLLRSLSLWNSQFDHSFLTSCRVEELDLSYCELTEADVSAICRIDCLKSLHINGCRLSGAMLVRLIDALPNLEWLDAGDQRVTVEEIDSVLAALRSAKNIMKLNMRHWSSLNDSKVDQLSQLTHLTSLNLDRTPITDEAAKSLKSKLFNTQFQARRYVAPPTNVSSVEDLHTKDELEKLTISHGPSVIDVLDIANHSVASRVDVIPQVNGQDLIRVSVGKNSNFSARDFLNVTRLTGLVEMDVGSGEAGTIHDSRLFIALGQMPQLVGLTAYNKHHLGEKHLQGLSASPSLKKLVANFQGMWDAEYRFLSQIKTLEVLDIRGTYATNPKIQVLCEGLQGLRILRLDNWTGTPQVFDDDAIPELLRLPLLEELSVYGCEKLTDACIPHLSKMTWLKSLNISKTSITTEGAEQLRKALPNAKVKSDGLKSRNLGEAADAAIKATESPGSTQTAERESELDLLSVVDVAKGTMEGQWSLVDGELTSQIVANTGSTLEIPAQPPSEFTLVAEVTRTSRLGGLHICFPFYSESSGIYIGGGVGTGIATIDGADYKSNKTSLRSHKPFVKGVTKVIEVSVKKKTIELRVDGENVLRFESNGETLGPGWTCEHPNWITLGCAKTEFRISKLKLIGHSGPIVVPPPQGDSSASSSKAGVNPHTTLPRNPESADAAVKSDAVLILTTSIKRDELGNVKVSLADKDGNEIDTASSDTRGRAIFRNLRPGEYQFDCQSDYSSGDVARKQRMGDLHRPTHGTVTVAESETTKHRVSLLPLRTVRVEYAEVVTTGDLITLKAGVSRQGNIAEAVTTVCHFPLTGMQNRTQSAIRIESSSDDKTLQMRCLPSGQISDLGAVSFDEASTTNDDWEKSAGANAAAVISNHVYLIRHKDGRRFKLRVSSVD